MTGDQQAAKKRAGFQPKYLSYTCQNTDDRNAEKTAARRKQAAVMRCSTAL